MRVPVGPAAFAAAVVLVFGAAHAVGTAAGPVDDPPRAAHDSSGPGGDPDGAATSPPADQPSDHSSDQASPGAQAPAGAGRAGTDGLSATGRGYTLRPAATRAAAGGRVPYEFTVTGPDGRPVTRYLLEQEAELHLIVVSRDLSRFQHVHPVRSAGGVWRTELDLRAAGTYRVFADFAPAALGGDLTLGTDLHVPGTYAPSEPAAPATRAAVAGYEVALSGSPAAGSAAPLEFTVSRGGRPVDDLEPYLGAFGHLVALRDGELSYAHTHPDDDAAAGDRAGPAIGFTATFPDPGTYRLFLQFRHAGSVRTAAFTVEVPSGPTAKETP